MLGFNVGINRNSKVSKRENVKKAFEFIVSKQIQRKFVIEKKIMSAVLSLYDDEEVCSIVNCKVRKHIQPIKRLYSKNYEQFSAKFMNIIFDYLFYNKIDTALEALQNIEDISKIYWIKLDDSILISISLYILITILSVMILSLIISFFEKFGPYFDFLPNDFWIILVIGIMIITSSSLIGIGPKTETKCYLTYISISLGSSLILISILHKLVTNFPLENKISIWSKNHKYYFLLIFCTTDILNIIFIFTPLYKVQELYIDEGKNYEVCKFYNTGITILISICISLKIIMIISVMLLIYIEWNLQNTYDDLRLLIIFVYTKILSIIFIIILNNINFKNYIYLYLINQVAYIFYSIISYITFFGIRIFWALTKKETFESKFIHNVNKTFIEKEEKFNWESTKGTSANPSMISKSNLEMNNNELQSVNNRNENNLTLYINSNNNTNSNTKSSKSNNKSNRKNIVSTIVNNNNNLIMTIYNFHNQKSITEYTYDSQNLASIISLN